MTNKSIRLLAWSIWLLGSTFVFYKYILEVSPNVLGMAVMYSFNLSGATLGALIATYFITYGLMQIPMGLLLDRYGPKLILLICILLCAGGSWWFGSSGGLWSAIAARFITGMGAAAAVIGCMKLISMWFPQNRFAFLVGLMMAVGMLGAVFGEMPLDYLVRLHGWRHALHYLAYGGLVLFVLFFIIVRDRKNINEVVAHPKIRVSIRSVTRNAQSWWLSLFSGLMFAPVSAFGGAWGVSFLQVTNHFSHHGAAQAVSGIFYGFAVGAPLWGWVSDYCVRRILFIKIGTLTAVICALLLIYSSFSSVFIVFIWFFIFGFGISAFVLSFTMIREVNMIIYAASAIGFMNVFNSALSAGLDAVIGKVLDFLSQGNRLMGHYQYSADAYHVAMSIIPAFLLLGLVVLHFIKETHCRQLGSDQG